MNQHNDAVPTEGVTPAPVDNSATIALLEQWTREDATDDPTAIAAEERELANFKAAMNANRPADRPIFP